MIRYAEETDIPILFEHDKHISKEELQNSVRLKRILVLFVDGIFAGWLRYNLFWDNTPFTNLSYVLEGERGRRSSFTESSDIQISDRFFCRMSRLKLSF